MVNVFLGETLLPVPSALKGLTGRLFGATAGKRFVHRSVRQGDSLNFVPQARLPDDLSWAAANPAVAGAFAGFAEVVEAASDAVLPEPVRVLVRGSVQAWHGEDMGLSRRWVEDAVVEVTEEHRAAARLTLLTALASYQPGAATSACWISARAAGLCCLPAPNSCAGTATGIDIYDPNAGGGSAERFWRNARAEGVAERVELLNVDARHMTFVDETFDVAVSSLAMHHIGAAQDRERATAEIIRILKPGGSLAICDMTAVIGDCEQVLRQNGMVNVRGRVYRHLFSILTAEKP